MLRPIVLVLFLVSSCLAQPRVYVTLWFDTEDYVEPASDDALLRIARDLTAAGVRATFKMVGEKARVLEERGRRDVIDALAMHDIGYHSTFHSIPPTPAVYLRPLGFLEGAEEFYRREGVGLAEVRRIFGVNPSCYGQPGSSWGPQSLPAPRRMGIAAYLDEGSQIGLGGCRERGKPFEQAIRDAGIERLRPVMITVGATILALFPLATHGGPLWQPLCYAQIGGLAVATFITLLLVPVLYSIAVMDLRIVKWETAATQAGTSTARP